MDNLENFIAPNLSGDAIHKLKLTGVQEAWYDNGQLCSRTHYQRGKLDGLYESWYDNGQQCELANYKRGKLDGVHLGWQTNGKVSELCHYQNGLLNGEYFAYDADGDLLYHTHCRKGYDSASASPLTGEYEIWDDSLSPQPMAVFYKGRFLIDDQDLRLQDIAEQEIDSLLLESEIRSRKLTGVKETYYDTGQISHREYYIDGLSERKYSWHWNGTKAGRITYKAGELDGVDLSYYDNGQLASRSTYKAGKREGVSEKWYANGQPQERCVYKNGHLDGLYESWHPNGELMLRASHQAGVREGLCEEWYANGQLKERSTYKAGLLCEQQSKITIPSSPVQEQAQAILDARSERNDNTLKNAQEEQAERKSQSRKL